MNRTISVILPCRNAAATIGEQLAALAAQDPVCPWEVVVVDNGSEDGSARIVAAFHDRLPRLSLIEARDCRNAAEARNRGVRQAHGGLLAFCDADDVVGEGWLRAMNRALGEARLVAGRLEWERLNRPEVLGVRAQPQQRSLQEWDPPFLPFGGGGNLGMARTLFDDLGGFDEEFDWLEDTDLCFRAQLAGHRLDYCSDAVVHVRLRDQVAAVYRQARGYGEWTVALHRRFESCGMRRRNPVRGIAGWGLMLGRIATVRDRQDWMRWVHRWGWKVGLLRGSLRFRMLVQ
ncbi:MAG: glycosyltransferase [Actinomycetota bacterium]|nr:glycosyltransferase [Actinomycetota bacterium]